jgi:hypothetical protein
LEYSVAVMRDMPVDSMSLGQEQWPLNLTLMSHVNKYGGGG